MVSGQSGRLGSVVTVVSEDELNFTYFFMNFPCVYIEFSSCTTSDSKLNEFPRIGPKEMHVAFLVP